jgi:hypothetical protein
MVMNLADPDEALQQDWLRRPQPELLHQAQAIELGAKLDHLAVAHLEHRQRSNLDRS